METDTGLVFTANVALVAPPATVTLAGIFAADGLSLLREITTPPTGAGPFSVTVPMEPFPPATVEGLRERDDSEGRFTVRLADLVTPPYTAEIVTAVDPDTGLVVTGNVTLLAPATTVTLDGTLAADELSLLRDTTAPPGGKAPLSVTVPVEGLPPTTLDGFTCSEINTAAGGVTVRMAVLVFPL